MRTSEYFERAVNQVRTVNMNRLEAKKNNQHRRQNRVRKTLAHSSMPRLSVFISNKNVYAQIIDDANGKTLVSSSTLKQKSNASMTERAKEVGQEIAKKAKAKKLSKVKFDRGAKQYHGRVKTFADAAREGGLEF